MVPDGDRRHRPQSRRIENEVGCLGPLDEHVVSVLVLSDDLRHRARGGLAPEPVEHLGERALPAQLPVEE